MKLVKRESRRTEMETEVGKGGRGALAALGQESLACLGGRVLRTRRQLSSDHCSFLQASNLMNNPQVQQL